MSNLLRLRFRGIGDNLNYLKRVKAHAERREPSTLLLKHILNFADLGKNKIQRTLHNMSVMFYAMLPYAILFFSSTIINFLRGRFL